MIEIKIIILLLFLHFLADFPLQSAWMSDNKSKNNKALFSHVLVHFAFLNIVGFKFALINALLHFVIDFITSRLGRYFYKSGKENLYRTTFGLDQFLHCAILFVTYYFLFIK